MWCFAKQLLKLQAGAWTTGKWWKETVMLCLGGRWQPSEKATGEVLYWAEGPWTGCLIGKGDFAQQEGLDGRCCSPMHSTLEEICREGLGVLGNIKLKMSQLCALVEMKSNCIVVAAAAAAEPPGQRKLYFCVSYVVTSGVLWTVLRSLVQTRDWQIRESLAKSHQEGFGAPDVWAAARSWVCSIWGRDEGLNLVTVLHCLKGVYGDDETSPQSHTAGKSRQT